jgi:hypothetical protein
MTNTATVPQTLTAQETDYCAIIANAVSRGDSAWVYRWLESCKEFAEKLNTKSKRKKQ